MPLEARQLPEVDQAVAEPSHVLAAAAEDAAGDLSLLVMRRVEFERMHGDLDLWPDAGSCFLCDITVEVGIGCGTAVIDDPTDDNTVILVRLCRECADRPDRDRRVAAMARQMFGEPKPAPPPVKPVDVGPPMLSPNHCYSNAKVIAQIWKGLKYAQGTLKIRDPSGVETITPHAWNVDFLGVILERTIVQMDDHTYFYTEGPPLHAELSIAELQFCSTVLEKPPAERRILLRGRRRSIARAACVPCERKVTMPAPLSSPRRKF